MSLELLLVVAYVSSIYPAAGHCRHLAADRHIVYLEDTRNRQFGFFSLSLLSVVNAVLGWPNCWAIFAFRLLLLLRRCRVMILFWGVLKRFNWKNNQEARDMKLFCVRGAKRRAKGETSSRLSQSQLKTAHYWGILWNCRTTTSERYESIRQVNLIFSLAPNFFSIMASVCFGFVVAQRGALNRAEVDTKNR